MEKGDGVLEQVKSRYWRGDGEMTHSCVTQAFLSRWESPSEGSAEWNRQMWKVRNGPHRGRDRHFGGFVNILISTTKMLHI